MSGRAAPAAPRRLIVTADDIGLHAGMTAGALRAHDAGAVTAVSVAAVGHDLDGAVAALRDRPTLDVGVHWVLVGERPLSPPQEVRSLLGPDGGFLPGYRSLALRRAAGRLAPAEVETELRRQTERLLAAGLRLVHANAHQHVHLLPGIFEVAARLAAEYRIPCLRLPYDPAVRRRPGRRGLELLVLHRLARRARRRLRGGVRPGAERTLGLLDAGRLDGERLRRALRDVAGTSELVCHPGIDAAALRRAYAWGYEWESETAALCAPGFRAALEAAGIELASFSRPL